jgi:hypothetical protein
MDGLITVLMPHRTTEPQTQGALAHQVHFRTATRHVYSIALAFVDLIVERFDHSETGDRRVARRKSPEFSGHKIIRHQAPVC